MDRMRWVGKSEFQNVPVEGATARFYYCDFNSQATRTVPFSARQPEFWSLQNGISSRCSGVDSDSSNCFFALLRICGK